MTDNRPWERFYGSVAPKLEYPEVTLYEALAGTARRVPEAIAWDFFGTESTYRRLVADVARRADALAAQGLLAGDRFLISMPTSPQGVIAFYAAIRVGALPALIHPLSTAREITQFLDQTGARMALTLDAFHATLAAATPKRPLERIVLARIPDYLPLAKRIGFALTKGRKIPKVAADPAWLGECPARVRFAEVLPGRASTTIPRPSSSRRTDRPRASCCPPNFISEARPRAAFTFFRGDAILAILRSSRLRPRVCETLLSWSGGKSNPGCRSSAPRSSPSV